MAEDGAHVQSIEVTPSADSLFSSSLTLLMFFFCFIFEGVPERGSAARLVGRCPEASAALGAPRPEASEDPVAPRPLRIWARPLGRALYVPLRVDGGCAESDNTMKYCERAPANVFPARA